MISCGNRAGHPNLCMCACFRLLIEEYDAADKSQTSTTDDVKARDPPQEGANSHKEATDADKDEFGI